MPMIVGLLLISLSVTATLINGWMTGVAVRRYYRLSGEGLDRIGWLTLRRTVRSEAVYLVLQFLILALTTWAALDHAQPAMPPAREFYFAECAVRAAVAILLAASSGLDLRDRRKIMREMNAANGRR